MLPARRHPAHVVGQANALRSSPFRLLDARGMLPLVLGRADLLEHDALCVALVCRSFRDSVWELCPVPATLPGHVMYTALANRSTYDVRGTI